MTILDNKIYQLTYKNSRALTYNLTDFANLEQFNYSGEGWGLTNDGNHLIMSNGSSTLTWRDPKTFTATQKIMVKANGIPLNNINELEYVNGLIYANIFTTNRIACIDPATGNVISWVDITTLANEARTLAAKQGYRFNNDDVANGIAYNSKKDTFYLAGKDWPIIFEVRLK